MVNFKGMRFAIDVILICIAGMQGGFKIQAQH
jgi:hypothetical protein